MKTLEGRTAIVTGAASGIGLAIAEALAHAGSHVMMTDLDLDAVAGAAASVADHGGGVEAQQLDVRDPDAVQRAADHTVERFDRS